jgi:nitrite reductase/ring-hydroxylating ferredoxin subunit
VPQALYWDTADPYHYVRLQRRDEANELLIVGGEDHKTGQASDEPERFVRLESWTRQHFPEAAEVAARWSGQVLEPMDGLAFIGRNPGDEANVFIATGDSGHGLTHGTIAGLLLTDLILGRKNSWANLYDPARCSLWAVGELVRENINTITQYLDWVKPAEVGGPGEVRPGEGAVLREGLRLVALYRDETGKAHRLSAVCPHLGCVVHWNTVEKTWDCPCHGSRFDVHGQVLNGPALRNLAHVEE